MRAYRAGFWLHAREECSSQLVGIQIMSWQGRTIFFNVHRTSDTAAMKICNLSSQPASSRKKRYIETNENLKKASPRSSVQLAFSRALFRISMEHIKLFSVEQRLPSPAPTEEI